jgi:hypothetical protein
MSASNAGTSVKPSAENDVLAVLVRLAQADGQKPVALSAQEGAALLAHMADLDLDAARYRWIRTHQYLGDIDPHDPCAPGSPNAIRFDRKIDGLRSECP